MAHRVRRALVSVHDKRGIVELCEVLAARGAEILSSGGTSRLLRERGFPVVSVSDYTAFPELLGGRVKTLHPRIHAGILAVRSDPTHVEELERAAIPPIDLVVVNLYPFEQTVSSGETDPAAIIEMIDVGGPTLVRAAAKNHEHVGVVVDPSDYSEVARRIRETGGLDAETRRRLATKAFARTSAYDAAVHAYLSGASATQAFPDRLALEFVKVSDLRYGENPHQGAAFYREPGAGGPSVGSARQVQGKELSYNNILDFDAALDVVLDLAEAACAIVKHGNPCGVATATTAADAFRGALRTDPLSAFGGVIAFNRAVDAAAAGAVAESFYEGVIAPGFEPAALEALAAKKNLRLLALGETSGPRRPGRDLRRVAGGLLAQDWDRADGSVRDGRVVTRRAPSEAEWRALEFAWTVVRHVKSNAIVYAAPDRTLGIGAGQMSRVDAARLGILKAQAPLAGSAMASDAFFPFRDGIDVAAEAKVAAVIQPGGSVKDAEVIAAADGHGMAMVFTGRRHFRH